MKKLLVIFGSTRPSRAGLPIGQWVFKTAQEAKFFDVSFVDLAEMNLPLLDEPGHPSAQNYTQEHTKKWSKIVEDADAFIFVTPEYDYFPPASLVNAVQFLFKEWANKPAGIVSYGGVSGGLRSTQALRLLLSGANLHTLYASVSIAFFSQYINEQNEVKPNEHMTTGINGLINGLHDFLNKH
jgi:NAD(P)H-dependent FMN reductase